MNGQANSGNRRVPFLVIRFAYLTSAGPLGHRRKSEVVQKLMYLKY